MVFKRGNEEKLFLVLSLVVSKVQVTQSHAIGGGEGNADRSCDSLRGLRQGGVRNKGNISVIVV